MRTEKILTSALAIALATLPQAAFAQADPATGDEASASAPTPEDGAKIQEIVVTAERRAGSLQRVPIAVSAVSEIQMAKAGIEDVLDIKRMVPSLNISSTFGTVSTSLRGGGSTAVNAGFENPVALYVDGVYIASGRSFLNLANVQQIEVLKGPQGTLFGRNATAGLVQVTTRSPEGDPTVKGEFTYGNYGSNLFQPRAMLLTKSATMRHAPMA